MTSTTTPPTAPMTFYDIALAPPVLQNACSPNPWKTRYALNFKKTPYKTTWVPLPGIPTVRGSLNIPASRTFADGTPYHTLPVLSDPATGRIVGDSFEIAQYLQETYPSCGAGDLLPAQDLGFVFAKDEGLYAPVAEAQKAAAKGAMSAAYVRFNTSVDSVFSAHAQLMVQGFPFDPATAEASKAEFSRRMGGVAWDDLVVSGEKRGELLGAFEKALGGLARLLGRDASGPFVMGRRASYADFIVGGWLRMSRRMLPGEEWEALKGWHGGVFGRLHEALEEFAQMD